MMAGGARRSAAGRAICGLALFAASLVLPGWAAAVERPDAALDKLRARSLEILETAAGSENAFIRSAAARAAGESASAGLIPLLKKTAADVYPTARLFSLQAMEKVSRAEARELALGLMKDSDIWVRSSAIEMLGKLSGPEAIHLITPHLNAVDPPERIAAAAALVRLGEKSHLALIEDALTGRRFGERYQALGHLGKIGSPEALALIVDRLADPEDETVYYSLKSLDGRASPAMAPKLLKLVHHKNPSVRSQAMLVLATMTGGKPFKGVEILCADRDAMVRVAAAVAARRMNSDGCPGVLEAAFQDADFGVRSTAARVLGEVDIPGRAELIALAMRDANSRVRTAAVRATGMMGGSQAFPILLAALDDPLEVVRTYAAGNLIRLLSVAGPSGE